MKSMILSVNQELESIVNKTKESTLKESMRYSLLSGGKRLRPLLMLLTLKAYGKDDQPFIDIAASLEMIHTYSLIHDDLPAMDDDDLRRGKLTSHKKFGEGVAILTGDALLTDAFSVIVKNQFLNDHEKLKLIAILSSASGSRGMIYGQIKDLEAENKTLSLSEMTEIHSHKTGCLIQAPLMMAAAIASPKDIEIWYEIGYHIGLAFQIQDDILDALLTPEQLGKSNSDHHNHKSTFVSNLGVEESQKLVQNHFEKAIQLIESLPIDPTQLLVLLKMLYKRER